MQPFPVIDSTLSATHLTPWLQERYELSIAAEVRLFRTGINHSYFITDGDFRAVWRIYSHNWRTREQIEEELRLINTLKENGVPVSYPIADRAGNFIQEVPAPEGLRYGVLFSFAEGKKQRFFSTETARYIGELMGRMHMVTENEKLQRIDYNAETLAILPYKYAGKFFPEENADMQFINRCGEKIQEVFRAARQAEIRSGIVHLDIWYDNMNIAGERDITLFDFDFCGNGWLLHDPAYFLMQTYHQEADKKAYEEKKTAFLEGYRSVASLSEEELRLFPWSGLSIWLFYLGVQSRRFDNWSNVFLSENYLIRFMGMVKDWLEYNNVTPP